MENQDQIKIIKKLLEATEELNGEFQDGWSDVINDGEILVSYLEKNTIDNTFICFMQYLSDHYNIDQVIDCTKHKEIINKFKINNQNG